MFLNYIFVKLQKTLCSFYFPCFLALSASFIYLSIEQDNVTITTKPAATVKHEPKYMLHGNNVESGYLEHVRNVLHRFGYERMKNTTRFDLLWSHVYPFGENAPFSVDVLRKLRSHQKVNHFPGSGYITNKAELATTPMKYIPPAFALPKQKSQLLEFAKQHPDSLFVQKNTGHRGIKILAVHEMDLNNSDIFVQEYVQNPLLVDGYKFDIGVYTVLTSIDPLRVYIYNADFLLRFCPKPYEPFDTEDIDKYVVGDDYIPTWEIPSLRRLYNDLKFGMKDSLAAYLRSRGLKPQKIWDQIEDSIRRVFINKEPMLIKTTSRFTNDNNFFELVRFDFVVDSELKVYLMEANMSPNLSSEHFQPNKLLYENVLFNVLSLVGVGVRTSKNSMSDPDTVSMQVSSKNVVVFPNECMKEICNTCSSALCLLCKHCLSYTTEVTLKHAYLEHLNRMDCKRVFPPTMTVRTKMEDLQVEDYTPENRMMMLWFLGKCLQDSSWC